MRQHVAPALYGVQGKMTRRLCGVVLGTQGLAVFFGALVIRSLALAGAEPSGFFLPVSVLAALFIVDAALLRRPWAVTLGWLLQAATLASAFVIPTMLVVEVLFGALWVTALVQGRKMDEHTRRVDARWQEDNEKAGKAERLEVPEKPGPETTGQESPRQDG